MIRSLNTLILCFIGLSTFSQGYFSGDIELNTNFFVRDSVIRSQPEELPHYNNLKSGSDAWMTLNYNNPGIDFSAGVRLDVFNNSILRNPTSPLTGIGIGNWYIRKSWDKLTVTGGYVYDQFGSGLVYRSFEERALGIDNALIGVHMKYEIKENWRIKAFTGVQKDLFSFYNPILKGISTEADFQIGENLQLIPGASAVNRTLDQESMSSIVANIEALQPENRFIPKFNNYAFSVHNTLNFKNWSWYVEGAYKTKEAIPSEPRLDSLINRDGTSIFSTLAYSQKGFGITAQFKRTENFFLRTSPNLTLFNGLYNFAPPISKQNSLRLPARYFAPSLPYEEIGFSLDITYKPIKWLTLSFNASQVSDFTYFNTGSDRSLFFREFILDAEVRKSKKLKFMVGGQFLQYNQFKYELKGDTLAFPSISPFAEITYKLDRRKSLRLELQTQITDDDFGPWVYGLLEFNIAPKWSLSVTDMWNYDPKKTDADFHYYSALVVYTEKAHRFSLSYVRQVAGIVCTGGVCRVEPAFSGVKFGILSSF